MDRVRAVITRLEMSHRVHAEDRTARQDRRHSDELGFAEHGIVLHI